MTTWEIQQTWSSFKCQADLRARSRLIEHFAYLVKITAGRVISNMPPSLERDDLVSAGIVGLIKAVDQYDTSRQVKFETYAIALIRGAILEMLREDDWVPRSTRERIKMLERTYREMEINLGRPASEDEMAAAINVTPEEYQKILVETGRTSLLSLEDLLVGSDGGEKLHLADVIQDDGITTTLEVEMHERKRMLSKSIDRLPDRERQVISLYYYEGMTFKEIGKILIISDHVSINCIHRQLCDCRVIFSAIRNFSPGEMAVTIDFQFIFRLLLIIFIFGYFSSWFLLLFCEKLGTSFQDEGFFG